jgi:hypothetical protein
VLFDDHLVFVALQLKSSKNRYWTHTLRKMLRPVFFNSPLEVDFSKLFPLEIPIFPDFLKGKIFAEFAEKKMHDQPAPGDNSYRIVCIKMSRYL